MATLSEVRADYLDHADYAEVGSVSKAKSFITACRKLLVLLPARAAHGGGGGNEAEFTTELVHREMLAAQRWVNAHDTDAAPAVIHADFSDFRS